MAYKVFQNGYPLPASELNNYLMNQTVMVFATASARAADIPSPTEGMVTYREDGNGGTGILEVYNGSTWVDINDNTAAIPKSIIDAAGDLIVGTAADTPARLAVGGSGSLLKSNGTNPAWLSVGTTGQVLTASGGDAVWAAVPTAAPTIEAFTSSGTWTVPAGVTNFSAYLMAGGRGGGQGEASNNASAAVGGHGGATGSYTRFEKIYCTPGDVWTVTVGAGGAGAAAIVNTTSGIKQGQPYTGSNGTSSSLIDPTGNLTITTNASTQSGSSVSVGGVAVTTNMTNAFAGSNGVNTVGNPTGINYYAITSTQAVGSNGTTAPTGTLKGTGGTASHSGTGGAGSQGQSATNATTLGTAMGDYAWFGGGAGGGAAASANANTVGGAGGAGAANTGGGGGGGGAAFRGSGTSSTGGAGGNGGSGFVAIVY